MDSIGSISVFVGVAETRSFTEAAKNLNLSSSAVGKSISRLEERMGARLFHRNTRSITLTAEGTLFLGRCRRILAELEAARLELSQISSAPRGKLHISVPLLNELIMPVLGRFMREYPDIELDIDMSDRKVEVIEEGFDLVIRTGDARDSRLMSRALGTYRLVLVAAPSYLNAYGTPSHPTDLQKHACIMHKFPASGKIENWPLQFDEGPLVLPLPRAATCTTTEAQYYLAKQGKGIACLPDFVVREAIAEGALRTVLDTFVVHSATVWTLWPAGRHGSPKLRVFLDFVKAHLFPVST